MQSIKLDLKERSYNIVVGSNIIKSLGKYLTKLAIGRDAYVITNLSIKKRYCNTLRETLEKSGFSIRVKVVPDTEKSKSIEMSSLVIRDIAHYDVSRRIFLIAFGGGVIGDLAGFIASVYKRGVPYIQVPTTLLAQVDSSIGGKTAVDLQEGKNLVGVFYQPRLVFSDVKFLLSLDSRQIRSGLSEVIKYALIRNPRFFAYLENNYRDILAYKQKALEYIVNRCSSIKAGIVQCDEREERGIRTILNFGHTVGHAIEAACDYKTYNHGEAIALGMLVASDISKRLGLINPTTYERIERLIRNVGLPLRIRRVSLNKIIYAHYHDKKFIGRKNRFVLIAGIGKTKIVEDIPLEVIIEALKARL